MASFQTFLSKLIFFIFEYRLFSFPVIVGVLLMLIIHFCKCCRSEIPKINFKKYQFVHEGFFPTPPFKPFEEGEKGKHLSKNKIVLRTYYRHPVFRAGNGMSDYSVPKAIVVFCPMLGSHMNYYSNVGEYYSQVGFSFAGIDYEGYGESEGKPGYLQKSENIVRDVIAYASTLKQKYPKASLFIAGHAFGGLIAIRCALDAPSMWTGMLLFAPDIHTLYSPILTNFVALVGRFIPFLPSIKMNPDLYSRNLSIPQLILSDRLFNTERMYAQTITELVNLRKYVVMNLSKLVTPFIVQHGLSDLVANPNGTGELLQETKLIKQQLKIRIPFPRCWHDMLHELEWEEAVQQSIDWMEDRLRALFLLQTLD